MNRLQKLKTQLSILHGQVCWAHAVGDYSLVMYYGQEIERVRKLIKQAQKQIG